MTSTNSNNGNEPKGSAMTSLGNLLRMGVATVALYYMMCSPYSQPTGEERREKPVNIPNVGRVSEDTLKSWTRGYNQNLFDILQRLHYLIGNYQNHSQIAREGIPSDIAARVLWGGEVVFYVDNGVTYDRKTVLHTVSESRLQFAKFLRDGLECLTADQYRALRPELRGLVDEARRIAGSVELEYRVRG